MMMQNTGKLLEVRSKQAITTYYQSTVSTTSLAISGKFDPLDPFATEIRISTMHKKNITKEYLACKGLLSLKQRYYDIFEYRQGLADGVWHTLKATGQVFGISACRVRQIEGRVRFEVEKRII